MTYYIGNETPISQLIGDGNPKYFYALRRTEDGDLYFAKINQITDNDDNDIITINNSGPAAENFEDFEYGVDFFDGRLEEDHSRPYANLQWDQYRWDTKNSYYYINDKGELVVRINREYRYPAIFTASITGTTMTVTAVNDGSGIIRTSMALDGAKVQTPTTVVTQLTSTETDSSLGGKGTYTVSVNYDGTPPVVTSTTITGTL
jgi:hypothetical protein